MEKFRAVIYQLTNKNFSGQELLDCKITLLSLIKWFDENYEENKTVIDKLIAENESKGGGL
jgi:hypothetical protein